MEPFITLAHSFSDDFKKIIEKLLFLTRENAISKIKPDLNNITEFLEFICLVHSGWKEAQTLIANKLIENLLEKKKLQLSKISNNLSKNDLETKLNLINIENIVLRRFLDSIAWDILQQEHSPARRLPIKGGELNFSLENIKNTMVTVDIYNKDPYKIAICNDITTFIHTGDILLFDIKKAQHQFIELKSGNKNILLSKIASYSVDINDKKVEDDFISNLSLNDKKHFLRVKKQLERGLNTIKTINNEGGQNQFTNGSVKIHATTHQVYRYSKNISDCYDQIKAGKSWAIDEIDNCLYIGVYKDWKQAFAGFKGWMSIIKCNSQVYNLTDSFRIPLTTPFASVNLPTHILNDILQGEVSVIICLNIQAFIDRANKKFPDLFSIASKRETSEIMQKGVEPAVLEGRAILSKGGLVGQGLIDRILFDLQKPDTIIKMFEEMVQKDSL